MLIFFSIIVTLVLFLLVVVVHELGHFLAARSVGVRVREFGIGIPPKAKILGKDRYGTQYTLNWLPIGGFVRLEGETPEERGPKSLRSKSLFTKIWVLIMGIVFNFLFAGVILSGLFFSGVSPLMIHNSHLPFERTSLLFPSFTQAQQSGFISASGVVLNPLDGGSAMRSGVLSGSTLLAVNGMSISTPEQALSAVAKSGNMISMQIFQSGTLTELAVQKDDKGKIQSYISWKELDYKKDFRYKMSLFEAIKAGFRETYDQVCIAGESLATLAKRIVAPKNSEERAEAVESLGGPIAAGKGVHSLIVGNVEFQIYIIFAALLSISIGFFNLLPFPALDGGRIVEEAFASLLRICGMSPKKYEQFAQYYHGFGFILLMILSVLIAFKDVFW
ncbi:MAG: M50 family metallopeptidase [Candidatus Gracilibacteria bacterium]